MACTLASAACLSACERVVAVESHLSIRDGIHDLSCKGVCSHLFDLRVIRVARKFSLRVEACGGHGVMQLRVSEAWCWECEQQKTWQLSPTLSVVGPAFASPADAAVLSPLLKPTWSVSSSEERLLRSLAAWRSSASSCWGEGSFCALAPSSTPGM